MGRVGDSGLCVKRDAQSRFFDHIKIIGAVTDRKRCMLGQFELRPQIEQAFADYRATGFGGWPWDRPDPVHGPVSERFARHADGRLEQPSAVAK